MRPPTPRQTFVSCFAQCLAVLGLACVAAATASAADYRTDWARMKNIVPQGYVCQRAAHPLTLDGRLDEADWKTAAWTQDFADIEGTLKPRPKFRTRAKLLWDDQYLYIAAELEEPHVWGTITEHDAVIFQDNDFEVFIDPDGDSHEYYEFELNALNTGWDLLLQKPYKDGGPALNSWEIPGLKTAVHVNGTLNQPADRDQSWTVELAFPWRVLAEYAHRPAPPREGDQWRVNFSRVEWQMEIVAGKYRKVAGTKEDNWVWSPAGIIDMHRPEQWGYVQFTAQPPGTGAFTPDAALPARKALHEVYYAEKAFYEREHRWAATLKELGLGEGKISRNAPAVALRWMPEGFEATTKLARPGGAELWHIRQDARIWRD